MAWTNLRASEQTISRIVIEDALYFGYSVSVFNGERTTLSQSRDNQRIFDAIGTTDEDRLKFYQGDKLVGLVWFTWGDEWTALTDYTDNAATRLILQRAEAIINEHI